MEKQKRECGVYFPTGNKVKFLLQREEMTQADLCSRLPSDKVKDGYVSVKTMSRIVNGHAPLTEPMAKKIAAALSGPDRHYRYTWLLYDDPYMTDEEKEVDNMTDLSLSMTENLNARTAIVGAITTIMALHGMKFIDRDPGQMTFHPFQPAATFGGFDFNGAELERISAKIAEIVGTELKYAVKEKEGKLTEKGYRSQNS